MPAQRWALVVERPTDEAFAALTSARRAFFISVAALAALATLAGLLVVRRVLGPIAALMRLVQRYARRDFGARSDVASGDELEALGSSLEHMADDLAASEHEIAKRARIETNLRRYMPAEAAEAAAKGESTLDLGGAKKRVTVVFADVVAFTGFAEKASPERAVAFLNELFTILSEIVFRHGGMVDKFIGDCVMAVFRPAATDRDADGRRGDDVARALAAAEDMHAFVASNLPRWREAYSFEVELGIGVSTGEVLMGNLGSTERMEYTVIGDAVNVAARLEALARPRQTLTTRAVVDACPDLAFTSLGEHALRGRAKPVEVFEVATVTRKTTAGSLDEPLGAGGMASIHRAHHERLGQAVAIKLLKRALTRRRRRARALQSRGGRRSPRCVTRTSSPSSTPASPRATLYTVLELVEGETLERLLQRGGAMALARAGALFDQLLAALEVCHDRSTSSIATSSRRT